jgi:hypothetical protein
MLHINVRFMHPMAREVWTLLGPITEMPPHERPAFEVVPSLQVGEQLCQTSQEVVERKVELPRNTSTRAQARERGAQRGERTATIAVHSFFLRSNKFCCKLRKSAQGDDNPKPLIP